MIITVLLLGLVFIYLGSLQNPLTGGVWSFITSIILLIISFPGEDGFDFLL